MINKTQEIKINEKFEDNSDYGQSIKEKYQKIWIKLKILINIKKSLVRSKRKVWKCTVTLRSSRFCWKCLK